MAKLKETALVCVALILMGVVVICEIWSPSEAHEDTPT